MHLAKNQNNDSLSLLKKITLILFIISYLSPVAFAQFRKIHYETTDNEVRRFSFYSPSEGYIAFQNNLGFTTDSGHTVSARSITINNTNFNNYNVNLTFGFNIKGVKALSKTNVIAYGGYANVPAILYSSDGGAHFKLVFHSQFDAYPNSEVNDMQFFPDGKTGYAIDNDRILKTTDGGLTWNVSTQFNHAFNQSIQVVNNNVIAFYKTNGGKGYIGVQQNGGDSWHTVELSNLGNIQCAYFINNRWWVNTYEGATIMSQDGGTSWTGQNNVDIFPFTAEKMIFTDENTGYAYDNGHVVYKTTDAGKIWEKLVRNNVPDTDYPVIEMQVLGNNIWAGGGHGYIELSTNSGGLPVPKAIFRVDTNGVSQTGINKLYNLSKTGYSYKWIVNRKLISTDYNATYHSDDYGPGDTIKLIVSNAMYADTVVHDVYYGKGVSIYSYSPNQGTKRTMVYIQGNNFSNVKSVTFGGVPAEYFEIATNNIIRAYVGNGNSGHIKITAAKSAAETKGNFTYLAPPVIASFSPQIAKKGDTLTIKGHYFNYVTNVSIGFNSAQSYNVLSDSVITAVVNDAKSTVVYISNNQGYGTLGGFKSIPVIDSVAPKSGGYGSEITLYGSALGEATSITLDGNPVLAITDTVMSNYVHIKLGEGSKGVFKVVTNNGSYTFNGFNYYQKPKIKSFVPLSASPGESIVISGESFSANAADNFVYFNNAKGTVTKASPTSLTVTVPPGATYGPINVTTHSNAVISGVYFTPTFKNAKPLSTASFITTIPNKIDVTHSFELADISNDGILDIVVPRMGYAKLGSTDRYTIAEAYKNTSQTGAFSFSGQELFYGSPYSGSYDGGGAVKLIDNDYNGKLDLLIAGTFSTDIGIMNIPDYEFTFAGQLSGISMHMTDLLTHAAYANMRDRNFGLAVGDFDSDGKLDNILFAPQYSMYKNMQPADFDLDDKPDAVNIDGQVINVFKNISTKGNVSFAQPISYDLGSEIKNLCMADMDGDGKMDIVVGTAAGKLVVLKNIWTTGAQLNFTPVTLATAINNLNTNTVADVDGDGKADILVSAGDNVNIYKNTGKPGLVSVTAPVSFALKGDLKLGVGDMDNDGRPDIVGLTNDDGDGVISILKNVIGTPVITFSPVAGTSGTTVEIKGTDFTGATNVKIGGIAVKSFVVNSATSITAKIDKVASGPVVIEKPGDYPTSLTPFVFVPKPDVVFYGPLVFETGGSVGLNTNNYDAFLSYQWQKDGLDLPDGASRGYIAKQAGSYTLINKYGSVAVTSDPVLVRTTFTLPADNFRVSATNVTCNGAANGIITIAAAKAMSYSALITSAGYSKTLKFEKELSVANLNGGTYSVCITIDDHPEFNQCFSLTISEPRDLTAYATINNTDVILNLDGGDVYNISINNNAYTTKESSMTLPLSAGVNKIRITTDKLCQGIINKLVSYMETPKPYPNPFTNTVNIDLGNKTVGNADIIVRDVDNGKQLLKTNYKNTSGVVSLDLANFKAGVYILNVNIDGSENIFKILK